MATCSVVLIFAVSILLFQRLCHFPVAAAISTIRAGDEVTSTAATWLLSDDRNFTLGFFSFGIGDTNYSYFGIWRTNGDSATKLWVANRESPIVNSTGGVLAIWESFDYPSNVLLPGMKLGMNLTSGRNWSLTSWLSENVPAAGAFTLSWEPTQDSGQLVIHRRGERYWNSGPFNNQTFEFLWINNPSRWYHHNLRNVSDNGGKYLSFDGSPQAVKDGKFPWWVFTPKGEILDFDNMYIQSSEFCYGYEFNGCVKSELPDCRNEGDTFQEMSADFPPNSGTRDDQNTSLSLSDCMESCWNDCACSGFGRYDNYGCIFWMAEKGSYIINPRGNAVLKYVLVSNPPTGKKWKWIVIAVAIFTILLGLVISIIYYRMRKLRLKGEEKKRRKEYLQALTASDSFNNTNEVENDIESESHQDLKIFSIASIIAATNSFSSKNKLGQGGFGPVYKGQLQEGREIAVKRLSRTSGQGHIEFKNELILITKLQHTNLVRVLGCCIHGEEKMLVYEYMPNKSLDSFLFDSTKRGLLDWKVRWYIIEGIAQGLLYLHKYSRMKVIHRDLKASNVLLDLNMNPKIADFGMARIFKQNETEAVTNRVVGTYGYMSPEYAMEGTFSVKSDVYSFGVLTLEIVSGRRNSSIDHPNNPVKLIEYAWELWKEDAALELKDPALGDSCDVQQLLRAIHVGLLCVQDNANDRPTMPEVISMLSNDTTLLPSPKQPVFFPARNERQSGMDEIKLEEFSRNDMSITAMLPR